ncbi:MAG: hypothetical protein CSA32_00390 [Desulfobulbus propionicus]|nr:MAG: hypothetical protein CSA32_00390 [Desulfobulbus propionicus]
MTGSQIFSGILFQQQLPGRLPFSRSRLAAEKAVAARRASLNLGNLESWYNFKTREARAVHTL